MAQNLFEKSAVKSFGSVSSPCIFISHSSKDKNYARLIADALLAMSIDIYFDENDKVLQRYSSLGIDSAIVKCIEDGLNQATHLLGVVTPNTKDSWWVPYEIGGATGRQKQCAHIVTADVRELPSFIKINKIFYDQDDLAKWGELLTQRTAAILKENIIKSHLHYASLNSILPTIRMQSDLKFY